MERFTINGTHPENSPHNFELLLYKQKAKDDDPNQIGIAETVVWHSTEYGLPEESGVYTVFADGRVNRCLFATQYDSSHMRNFKSFVYELVNGLSNIGERIVRFENSSPFLCDNSPFLFKDLVDIMRKGYAWYDTYYDELEEIEYMTIWKNEPSYWLAGDLKGPGGVTSPFETLPISRFELDSDSPSIVETETGRERLMTYVKVDE